MEAQPTTRSAASRVFFVLLAAAIVVGAATAVLLALSAQRAVQQEAESVTGTLARSLAESPELIDALADADRDAATAVLQPYTDEIVASTPVEFVTVMAPDGTRITHPDPDRIGEQYLGTIPQTATAFTEEYPGTLGPSIRTIAPVFDQDVLVGWVSTGVTVESIGESFVRRLPTALAVAGGIVAAGILGALLAARYTRRIAGDLPAGAVRDAVSSYESVRTLSEALRAQTHEHGNRMHTAVALIELGRSDEAVEILAETSRQSQSLVDQVSARRAADPAIGALLLGKASQAKERGIHWEADIDPRAPASVLSAVDSVSVLGNLIDNALDAVATVDERWVRVAVRGLGDTVRVEVADSGPGVPDGIRERIFEHGFSTKPAGSAGRGVGLALVKALVTDVGGTLTLTDNPTTFTVVLPARESS